jgi:serine/threonine protein kinase
LAGNYEAGSRVLLRYEVKRMVAQRQLGCIYHALDRETDVEVALWVVNAELLPDPAARQMFVQRVSRSRSLSHPNLIRLYEVTLDGDQAVVVVQWAQGTTLRDRLEKSPLPIGEVRVLAREAASALQHAHSLGIVVGDLRPETAILLPEGLKLTNVGVAPAIPRARYLDAVRDTPVMPRLAPEIRAGLLPDSRADVYALALLCVEALTGKLPDKPLTLPDAPKALTAVLERALQEDPLLRHASIETFVRDLDSVLATGALPAVAKKTPPRLSTLGEDEPTHHDDAPTDNSEADDEREHQTRQIGDEELARLRAELRGERQEHVEITRQVPIDELFPLRMQSSGGTQQIEMSELEPLDENAPVDDEPLVVDAALPASARPEAAVTAPGHKKLPEIPAPPPAEGNGHSVDISLESGPIDTDSGKTEPIVLLDADAAKTIPVEKVDAHEMPEPPPPIPVHEAPPIPRPPRPQVSDLTPTPLPPPSPAPPSLPPQADEFGDDNLKTTPHEKLDDSPGNLLPPKASEVIAQKRPTPAFVELPKIEVQIPVEPPTLPAVQLPAPRPVARTLSVPPISGPPRTRTSTVLIVIMIALGIATGVSLAVASHLREMRLAQERAAKQRLAEELRAAAEAMRAQQAAAAAAAANGAPTPSKAAPAPGKAPAPVVQSAGPCPLGANLVVAGKSRYCVDVYEYPGGKTIPRTAVSFDEAGDLCRMRGERLCTDLEWERACRGKSGASFPYGAAFEPDRCNVRGNWGEIAPAGSFKDCKSASGAYDMSGNVAEWVTAKGQPAQKGGSAQTGQPAARCSNTVKNGTPGVFVGFRCCADPR